MSEHTLPEERAAPRKPDHTEDSGALPERGSTAAGRKFRDAPGRPGAEPRWFTSAKSGVGTAINAPSRVWFTLARGVVSEVFWPRVDLASLRSLGLVVTDRRSFSSDEQADTEHRV